MKRLTLALGLVALAAVLAACSGASAAPATADPATSTPPNAPAGDAVTIVAKDMAFVQTAVNVPAGKPFEIVFDNQEGAPHNVAISDASGASVFKGEIVSATKVTYAVPPLAAGAYPFICEVHPNMTGTITAN